MGLRQVVARWQAGLEQQPGARGLGDGHPVHLHSHVPGAGQDVHPGVRVTRVGEDLLVLFEPGVHRVPVEADQVAQLFDRRVLVSERGAGRVVLTGPYAEYARISAAGGVREAAVGVE